MSEISSSDAYRAGSSAPLYAFTFPPTILADLHPRQITLPASHPLSAARKAIKVADEPTPSTLGVNGAFTCALTGASFADLDQLKEHYRTDWYRYNAKLRSQGKPTGISEEAFTALVDGLSASISGSDASTSDSDSDAASPNAVSRLLSKQQLKDDPEEDYADLTGPRSAILWFEAPNAAPGTQYGVYRAALPQAGFGKKRPEGPEILQELRSLQLPDSLFLSPKAQKAMVSRGEGVPMPDAGVKERKWTLMMFGGGHFAAMVVSLVPRLVSKGKGKEKEREVVIIEKKTFHRYTTRRKQGGSQGANDNAKGNAKSAGAALRRYNESALSEDVRDLLGSWKQEIAESELIFMRASKTYYKTFFDYEGAPLSRKDPRIRGFSFPTRRPTISELARAFTELTRVKVSHLTAAALADLDAAYIASVTPAPAPILPPPKVIVPKPAVIKLSKEEEVERDRWTRLVDMARRGKVEALSAFLDKYGPELEQGGQGVGWGRLPSWMDESRTLPTLLHVASAGDQPEMVRYLLVNKRADPTVAASLPTPVPALSPATSALSVSQVAPPASASPTRPIFTPYELAPSKATRNIFRFLTLSNPTWWDWTGSGPTGARVPSGLSEEKEIEKEGKAQEQRDRLREKQLERERDHAAKEAVVLAAQVEEKRLQEAAEIAELFRTKKSNLAPTGPRRLGGGIPRAVETRDASTAGLSEAARMRVERERRARAAEARFGGGGT